MFSLAERLFGVHFIEKFDVQVGLKSAFLSAR